jgi:anti-repressor protein
MARARDAMDVLDDDEKQQVSRGAVSNRAGTNAAKLDEVTWGDGQWVVSEPGLYSLIQRSRKPEAKAFKRWVNHDVLPRLRKTGTYVMERMSPRQLAELVIAEADRADRAEAQVAEMTPRADLADVIAVRADSEDRSWSAAEVAKILSADPGITIGRNRLFGRMLEWKFIFRSAGDRRLTPMQTAIDRGLLTLRAYNPRYDETQGEMIDLTPQIRVTWKGMIEIHRRLKGQRPVQQLLDAQPMLWNASTGT